VAKIEPCRILIGTEFGEIQIPIAIALEIFWKNIAAS